MSTATYKTIPTLIATCTPYKHGSSYAYVDQYGNYQIVSYSTLIATAHTDGKTYLDTSKYSMTTSRLQNIIKRAWGLN